MVFCGLMFNVALLAPHDVPWRDLYYDILDTDEDSSGWSFIRTVVTFFYLSFTTMTATGLTSRVGPQRWYSEMVCAFEMLCGLFYHSQLLAVGFQRLDFEFGDFRPEVVLARENEGFGESLLGSHRRGHYRHPKKISRTGCDLP